MANILDIRRRIRSVVNTRQITKAMKTVSAAKLRRAQEGAMAARPYSQMLANVLKSLMSRADTFDPKTGRPRHPLLAERPEHNILLIVVTGDKGLAGAFNTNILKLVTKFIQSKPEANIDIESIGRKGRDFMRRRYPLALLKSESGDERPEKQKAEANGEARNPQSQNAQNEERSAPGRKGRVQIVGEHIGVLGKVEYKFPSTVAQQIVDRYMHEEIDSVYILFNEFKSVIAQRLVAERILPVKEIGEVDIRMAEEATEDEKEQRAEAAKSEGVGMRKPDTEEIDQAASKFGTESVDYIYEQPPEQLFRDILPKYITIQIFHALLESVAAEHAARMTAMDSATSNASDMIDSLTLVMNRARQAKITKEIIEIVSGAAAQ
jgi:F-type H+-transporting ATPase subunit gamma